MQTGLHRNTISKVYRQLEDNGLVDSRAGSGIYVTARSQGATYQVCEPRTIPKPTKLSSLNELLNQGVRSTKPGSFSAEIDWRLRSSGRVLVTAPASVLES